MHDLLITGGLIFDGLGSTPVAGDVAVHGDRVVGVGSDLGPARRVLHVPGAHVAPGFVDSHAHSDWVPTLADAQPFKLFQGVTTEIVGNCGFSYAPMTAEAIATSAGVFSDLASDGTFDPLSFAEYRALVEKRGTTNNIAALIGHNTLRLNANGMAARLRPGALARMAELAAESFEAGAIGLSSGLIYPPGCYSDTDELVELAKVAHAYGRPYATHMRSEDRGLMAALDEAIEIGRRARVAVQISHCKVIGRSQHGQAEQLLERLWAARVAGIDVRGDQYPYLAGGTFLSALLPDAAHEGGTDALVRRLSDRETRERLRLVAEDGTSAVGTGLWNETEPDGILITSHARRPEVIGSTIAALAGDPWQVVCDLLAADPGAGMVVTIADEADVRRIMADPLIGIGSDNGVPIGLEHPRTWGCFPRFFGTYVREAGIVDWPEAIRKATSAIADQFGLRGRGWLGAGSYADIVVFDPDRIGHAGDYLNPAVRPDGITHVLLGGLPVVENGSFTGERAGRFLTG